MIERPWQLNTKIWGCEAFEPQPVVETVWPILSKLNLKPITFSEGEDVTDLQEMRVDIMEGSNLFFSADKIEKLIITIQVVAKRLNCAWVEITPNNDYDFPIFEADIFEYPDRVFFLLDMHPLRDLVVDEWYRQKYLDPVKPIWKKYIDLDTGGHKSAGWLSSFLSPYSLTGIHKPMDDKRSNIARLLECTVKYLEYYVDNVIANVEPLSDPEEKSLIINKKLDMRKFYRSHDPTIARMSEELGFDLLKKSWWHNFF